MHVGLMASQSFSCSLHAYPLSLPDRRVRHSRVVNGITIPALFDDADAYDIMGSIAANVTYLIMHARHA